MKKCGLVIKKVFFKFIPVMMIITLVGPKGVFSEANISYPCILSFHCETGKEDSVIRKIVVDYYDDLGSRYRWTHKVHTYEELTDCQAATCDHFPYKYASCKDD